MVIAVSNLKKSLKFIKKDLCLFCLSNVNQYFLCYVFCLCMSYGERIGKRDCGN